MILTEELARKYIACRTRYLRGPLGLYSGGWDQCAAGYSRRYTLRLTQDGGAPQPFMYAPFMITSGDGRTDNGTFLNADNLYLCDGPADMERRPVIGVTAGDNLVYSSIALTTFAAEYSLTFLQSPLNLVNGILGSYERLGSYQRGYLERGNAPFGFLLRSDSADAPDRDENICNFEGGDGTAAMQLAPSFDQYATLLSSLRFTKSILDNIENDVPAAHRADYERARYTIVRVVSRCIDYITRSAAYTIRWEAGGRVRKTAEDRGPYCHHVAYPFGIIAAIVRDNDPAKYAEYIGPLSFGLISEITLVLSDLISHACREEIPKSIHGMFSSKVEGTTDEWDLLARLFNIAGRLSEEFDSKVLQPILDRIVDPIIAIIGNWDGNPSQPIDAILSQVIYDLFIAGVLLDTTDDASFNNTRIRLPLRRILQLVGTPDLPTSLPIGVDFTIEPPKPGWWKSPPLPRYDPPSWHIKLDVLDIDLTMLLDNVVIDIPGSGLLRRLAATRRGKDYLRFHGYMTLSAADLFDPKTIGSAVDLAKKYDNAWFMALAHRFHQAPYNDPTVSGTLDILKTAPDTFPHSRDSGLWNADFRWIRDGQTDKDGLLYGGLDLMAPLMVACSVNSDAAANRETLLKAMMTQDTNNGDSNVFKLPFIGEVANQPLLELKAGGTQGDKTVYISVEFDRPAGADTVVITIPTLTGATEDITFTNRGQSSKLVVAPLKAPGFTLKSVSVGAKGNILIFTGD